VPAALLGQPVPGVHQDDRQVGSRSPGDHIPRVLDVPGRVGDDEFPPRRREIAVSHVDGDSLLALGPQAIGQEGQVRVIFAALLARALDRRELVLEDRLRVVQQPADQGRLPVVDRAGRRQPQDVHDPVPFCPPGAAGAPGARGARSARSTVALIQLGRHQK
jgi:hypothetical protein